MIEIKPMKFPSLNFPGADLRVDTNTKYTFRCIICNADIYVPFGWIFNEGAQDTSSISSELDATVDKYFADNSHLKLGNYTGTHRCRSCNIKYVVQAKIDETSWGAYEVKILGVAQIS